MASTYSQYKIELVGTGEQAGTWGTTTNNNFGSATPGTYQGFEQAIGGKATIDLSAGGTIALTLTNSNGAQNARALFFDLSGSPSGAVTLQVPAIQKSYIVKNGSGQTVTVEISGGTGVAVPNGSTTVVYADGTNVVTALNYAPALTLGAALPVASGGTGSTSTTFVNLATNVTGTLPVANGGTGITSFGTGVATALGQNVTGSGGIALATSPTFVTPVLGTPTSGTLSTCTVDGTDAVGFRNTPVNSKSEDYILLLADSGKTIFHPAADTNDRTFTIPAESSVNYAVGTVVTFINLSANDLTIAITTDTMYLAGDGSTTSRTLAQYGVASAVKVAGTTPVWVISGNGLT
jgi:hypothetical protein